MKHPPQFLFRLCLLTTLVFGGVACEGEGETTETVAFENPCEGYSCGDHGRCAVGADGPLCVCDLGFEPSEGGCSALADPCADHDCGEHGRCAVAEQTAVCLCDGGYVLGADGGCHPTEEGPDLCAERDCGQGVCVNTTAGPRCLCNPGFREQDGTCALEAAPCEGVTCDGQGVCALTGEGEAVCVCGEGYHSEGARCVVDGEGPSVCDGQDCGEGACVVTGEGAPLCVCFAGAALRDGQCLAVADPCHDEDCDGHGACVVTTEGARCLCAAGFVETETGCEPASGDPCATFDCAHGVCVVSEAQGRCVCEDGFRPEGQTCVGIADPCLDVTCSERGTCLVSAGTARCLCDPGYLPVGLRCEQEPGDAIPTVVTTEPGTIEAHPRTGGLYVRGELLVYGAVGHDPARLAQTITDTGGAVAAYEPRTRRYVVRFPSSLPFDRFELARERIAGVADASVVTTHWVHQPASVPDDPWGGAGWSEATPAGRNWHLEVMHALSAWDGTTGGAVRVGLIDFGLSPHADLDENLAATNPLAGETLQANLDHGTAMAGLLAARADNQLDLTGVIQKGRLYFCQTDGTLTRFSQCLDWLKAHDIEVVVYGGARRFKGDDGRWLSGQSPCLDNYQFNAHALEVAAYAAELSAVASGIALILPSGNEGLPTNCPYALPAASIVDQALRNRVLVVGAHGALDRELTCYSNSAHVDLVAPGGDGTCLMGGIVGADLTVLRGVQGVAPSGFSGTSAAAALAAGAVGLVAAILPEASPAQWVQLVRQAAAEQGGSLPVLMLDAVVAAAFEACAAQGGHLTDEGVCATGCVPHCQDKPCGDDDGCGGRCSTDAMRQCDGDTLFYCDAGVQRAYDCGRLGQGCGVDPDVDAVRCLKQCEPLCGDQTCGRDPVCGILCGTCAANAMCQDNQCISRALLPEGWVRVEPGEFLMGSPANEPNHQPDEALHRVRITRPFGISTTELTQGEWSEYMLLNPSFQAAPNLPVETVTFYEALAYSNARSVAEGLESCYRLTNCQNLPGNGMTCGGVEFVGLDCTGYRLPTEAEWEYAARAGNQAATYGPALNQVAWYQGVNPQPVGGLQPNAWGLFDVLGNVREWTWDYHADDYGGLPGALDAAIDPLGPATGRYRIQRGSSMERFAEDVRLASRDSSAAVNTSRYAGFRLVRTVP